PVSVCSDGFVSGQAIRRGIVFDVTGRRVEPIYPARGRNVDLAQLVLNEVADRVGRQPLRNRISGDARLIGFGLVYSYQAGAIYRQPEAAGVIRKKPEDVIPGGKLSRSKSAKASVPVTHQAA